MPPRLTPPEDERVFVFDAPLEFFSILNFQGVGQDRQNFYQRLAQLTAA